MKFTFFNQLLAKVSSFWLANKNKLKIKIKPLPDKYILLVLLLSLVFFFLVSGFIYVVQTPTIFNSHNQEFIKWLSPDETANYIFTKLYGQTGQLTIFERYNLPAADIIHPRSFLAQNSLLKPMSFLGIIIYYGWLVALTSYKLIPYFTPVLAALALFYFYLLVKEIFSRPVALAAVFLLAVFPPFIYYSVRSMFHNVGFAAWLIIGFYYLSRWLRLSGRPNYLAAGLAGIFFGLALAWRTVEIMWLGPALALVAILNWRRLNLVQLSLFLGAIFLALLPVFYWNQILYGAFWRGGYPQMNQSISQLSSASLSLAQAVGQAKVGVVKSTLRQIKQIIFYFGFRPKRAHLAFSQYGLKMFFWLFYPAIFGLFLLLVQPRRLARRQKIYLLVLVWLSLFLIYYYGSWEFYDNPDHSQATIGNSYTRYWLPLYLAVLPLSAFGLISLGRLIGRRFGRFLSAVFIIVIMILAVHFVLFGSNEGLIPSLAKIRASRFEFSQVLKQTEANAVIITRYHDKLFFPERKVVVGLFDDVGMVRLYRQIAEYLPLYYYNFTLPPPAITYLNQRRLGEVGLKIKLVAPITSQFSLYKIITIEP